MKIGILLVALLAAAEISVAQTSSVVKIRSEKCGSDNKCFIFAFAKTKRFDEPNMKKLAAELAERYKERAIVNFNIFDNDDLIDAFLDGKRSPSQIQSDRRGYFIHDAACGDILFYKLSDGKIAVIRSGWNDSVCKQAISI